ncbi:MFS transporter [Arthrobacter sp. I2-34]|uniref:MFS transporter n=1 Tax=Arthrobacter hankyongi TaxID=2904801 RepID=A0ABS9L4W3_9MICC|nr:MFS transporter [Arthrobacter hankyongi]MCG2621715.1 MFS transporter [Arthrobacter hankyongi]
MPTHSPPARRGRPRSGPMRSLSGEATVLWVAILASFVAFLDASVVNVALPAIDRDLGGGLAVQQWVVGGYLLALGALILVAGALSDVFGRIRILRAGLLVFGAASLACAAAPAAAGLVAARIVQGSGAALLVPASLALITSTFGGREQHRAIGVWTAWTGTAYIIGPVLGGLLVDTVGWRVVFAVNVLPVAATLWLLARLADPPRAASRPPVDVLGVCLTAAGLAGPVFALIEQQRLGWTDPRVLVPLSAGLISLAVFVWCEHRTPDPMMPLQMFGERNFGVGNIATAGIYAGLALGLFALPVFLQQAAGFSAAAAGLATLPMSVLSLALAAWFGRLSGRYGPRLFMAAGPVLAGTGFLLMVSVHEPLAFWPQILPGVLLAGLGLAATVAPLTAAVLGAVAPQRSGIASAVNNAVARIAGLVAIAAAGTITGGVLDYPGFRRAALAAALLLYAGGVVSAVAIRNRP